MKTLRRVMDRRGPGKLSRLHRPEGMSLEAWQTALRRQFGREQTFQLKSVGVDRVAQALQALLEGLRV